jgi:hypothetical protein
MFYSSEKCLEYLAKYKETKNIYYILACFSADVWETMQFASEENNFIGKADEREFTNDLVRQIAMLIINSKGNFPIQIYHSEKENVNGSDLEIILQIDVDKYIILACQAKRLYVNEPPARKNNLNAVYKSINHEVGIEKKSQIELLLNYADIKGAYPMYMLYNYSLTQKIPTSELYGCTLISAKNVYERFFNSAKFSKLKFDDIHPPAKPLINILTHNILNEGLDLFGDSTVPKSYSKVQIESQSAKWVESLPNRRTDKRSGQVKSFEEVLNKETNNISKEFAPKFRILINTL